MHIEADFQDHYPPRRSRVHEAYGASVYAFVADLCEIATQPVFWIYQGYNQAIYYYDFAAFCVKERLYFIHANDAKTQLWCMEEALMSNSAALVICEQERSISFRDMRRLQLAAERGQSTGIIITSERITSPATETRWHCKPQYDEGDLFVQKAPQLWSLIKNKKGILGEWRVDWNDKTHRRSVV